MSFLYAMTAPVGLQFIQVRRAHFHREPFTLTYAQTHRGLPDDCRRKVCRKRYPCAGHTAKNNNNARGKVRPSDRTIVSFLPIVLCMPCPFVLHIRACVLLYGRITALPQICNNYRIPYKYRTPCEDLNL